MIASIDHKSAAEGGGGGGISFTVDQTMRTGMPDEWAKLVRQSHKVKVEGRRGVGALHMVAAVLLASGMDGIRIPLEQP